MRKDSCLEKYITGMDKGDDVLKIS